MSAVAQQNQMNVVYVMVMANLSVGMDPLYATLLIVLLKHRV